MAESEVAEGSMDESETVETPPIEENGAAMDIDVDSNAANKGAEVLLSLGKELNPNPIYSSGDLSKTSSVLSPLRTTPYSLQWAGDSRWTKL
jgi:predicted secreted protein